jgi:hypothetical protein
MSSSESDPPAPASETEPSAPVPASSRNTHFLFQAKVFQAPGAHFKLVNDGQGRPRVPMFAVDMGSGEAVISLKHLRANFGIPPGSSDDQLVERAEAGLHYVPDIRPGDAIPNELLDGTASWTVARKHKRIARERIQAQLIAWATGHPIEFAGPDELKAIMDVPAVKKTLRDGFQKAAVSIGFTTADGEKVVDRIETLARELCYIEALRERCEQVTRIRAHLERLTKAYNNDQRTVDEIGRCKKLMIEGMREIFTPLALLDARLSDILGVLKTVDEAIATVRQTRDDIHFILMHWDPVIAKWQDLEPIKGMPIEKALIALYQFLAGRFATGKSIMKRRR